MQRRSFVSCAAAACAALAFSHAEPVVAAGSEIATTGAARDYRLSGPFAHENLAIYLVHGAPGGGPVPLTLQEALETGGFKVYETNDVNELAVQNLGGDPVFIQSGDIVKGGQQDRVLTVSLVLPPKSGRVSIGAFCVEQGRWAARGKERADSFSSAAEALPSREAKLAIKAPKPAADIGSRQHEVWRGVADMQGKLERASAPASPPRPRRAACSSPLSTRSFRSLAPPTSMRSTGSPPGSPTLSATSSRSTAG